jgi:hypothetical protein
VITTLGSFAMTYPRRFARVKPTGQVSNVGKIIVAPRDPIINCTIVDYSPGGACLDVGLVDLPQRFELLWGPTKKKCRMVWKRGRRAGVVF